MCAGNLTLDRKQIVVDGTKKLLPKCARLV
jgi:hypothetical protein